ncbi:MAG: hypothetical protein U0Z17_10920 [Bacteroidales bacterium]
MTSSSPWIGQRVRLFQLYKSLEKYDLSKDPLMLAYRGAASAASAGTVSGVRKN